ncbi:MAG TPA: DUF2254 family protein [Kofleriaceae bacterium]|nr:DUF2254 family protein [Kofleriaceae bacterium]
MRSRAGADSLEWPRPQFSLEELARPRRRSVASLFVRPVALAIVGFALFFSVEFYLEWRAAGYPGAHDLSWAAVGNTAKLVDTLSPIARAYNNLLAMLIATIGFAIPLTANMHTPKLIEMFLRDRINRAVLTFIAFGAAHVLWVSYIVGPAFAPTWSIAIAVYMALLGWALLIPYFFYVVRFIDPSRLVTRLRDASTRIVERAARRKADPAAAQQELTTRIGQIGTITIKALDRNDRDVAAEGAWALKLLLDHYGRHKARMPREWFVVDRSNFVGFSEQALDMLVEARTWYEMKVMQQLELAFLRSMHGCTDTVAVFSDALRVIACRSHERKDDQALRLQIRFFNNFLREAIRRGELRAVYDVLHQYRQLARTIIERDDLVVEIGRHFTYYAGMARTYGMVFAPQLAVFDLGYITRRAYDSQRRAAPALLEQVLALPHRTGADVHSMAVKAKLILGAYFIETRHEVEAEAVRKNLRDVDREELARAEVDLLSADRSFFEVTDRQHNLEYVPPERRESLGRFCRSLDADAPVPIALARREAPAAG